MSSPTPHNNEQIKVKIENFCAYQERCSQEVIKKLKALGLAQKKIDALLSHLSDKDLINEVRFAQSFSRGKFRIKKWGKQKITQELRKRNISKSSIEIGIKEIEKNYSLTCEKLADKIWDLNKSKPLIEKKKKIWNYLRYRGWERSLIFAKIEALEKNKPN